MRIFKLVALITLALATACAQPQVQPEAASPNTSFNLEEATIADLQSKMESGEMTSRQIVETYIARIEEIDRSGPTLFFPKRVDKQGQEKACIPVFEKTRDAGLCAVAGVLKAFRQRFRHFGQDLAVPVVPGKVQELRYDPVRISGMKLHQVDAAVQRAVLDRRTTEGFNAVRHVFKRSDTGIPATVCGRFPFRSCGNGSSSLKRGGPG